MGFNVGEHRVRAAMGICLPTQHARRRDWMFCRIMRRSYHAEYADEVWHTDMNLKLVDYGIYWTAGVDGFSRMVLWLEPVTNRRAVTIWPFFAAAARERGAPDQLVTDFGGENRLMAFGCWMWHAVQPPDERPTRAPHRGVGSVHNVRVERLWGDVNMRISRWVRFFGFYLEGSVGFDPTDSVHLGSFHRVIIPAMKLMGQMFVGARNERRVQASKGRPGTGGVPIRRAADVPRPPELHRAIPFQSAAEISAQYAQTTGNDLSHMRQLRGPPDTVDPLQGSPNACAQREYLVLDFCPIAVRVDCLHRGGRGLVSNNEIVGRL
mmetsp:Transcript_31131/g.77470  ORF Transcript_31131/g.77470 Transcript_31131/m.77470 type:complete len:322 (+) Transcript_31131:316-1281(+)